MDPVVPPLDFTKLRSCLASSHNTDNRGNKKSVVFELSEPEESSSGTESLENEPLSSIILPGHGMYYSSDEDLFEQECKVFHQIKQPVQKPDPFPMSENQIEDEEEILTPNVVMTKPRPVQQSRDKRRSCTSWETEHQKILKRGNISYEWYTTLDDFKHLVQDLVLPNASVLEIGCGLSCLSQDLVFSGYSNVVAVDWSETAIQTCKERSEDLHEVEYHCMDARDLALASDVFSAVISKAMLDFVASYDEYEVYKILREMYRVLRSGGVFLALTCRTTSCWWSNNSSSGRFMKKYFTLETQKPVGRPFGTLSQHEHPFSLLVFRKHETLKEKHERLELEEIYQANISIAQEFFNERKSNRLDEKEKRRRFWEEMVQMETEDMESQYWNSELRYLVERQYRQAQRSEWDRMDSEMNQMQYEDSQSQVLQSIRLDCDNSVRSAIDWILKRTETQAVRLCIEYTLAFLLEQVISIADKVPTEVYDVMQSILEHIASIEETHLKEELNVEPVDLIDDVNETTDLEVAEMADKISIAEILQEMLAIIEAEPPEEEHDAEETADKILIAEILQEMLSIVVSESTVAEVMQDLIQKILFQNS